MGHKDGTGVQPAKENGNGAGKPMRLGHDCEHDRELKRLQIELVKLQEWIRHKGLKLVVVFEGRDAAGKGGAIKPVTETLNPRICVWSHWERSLSGKRRSGIFQRYAAHLPGAGEVVTLTGAGTTGPGSNT